MQLLPIFPGTYLIIAAKGGRKMLGRGVAQFFRDRRDLLAGISEQDDGCGHPGFRFLLLERFLILLHQQALRLPRAELQSVRQVIQG